MYLAFLFEKASQFSLKLLTPLLASLPFSSPPFSLPACLPACLPEWWQPVLRSSHRRRTVVSCHSRSHRCPSPCQRPCYHPSCRCVHLKFACPYLCERGWVSASVIAGVQVREYMCMCVLVCNKMWRKRKGCRCTSRKLTNGDGDTLCDTFIC